MEPDEILNQIKKKEKRAKYRAALFTFIPLVAAIVLISYTSVKVYQASKELNDIKTELGQIRNENERLKMQNDSLINTIRESTVMLGKAASVLSQFKEFVDKIYPPERTAEEAQFYINFRMFEERVRGDYNDLSRKVSKLPDIADNRDWVVVVASSVSLEDLKREAGKYQKIFGAGQVAIYKAGNYYALVVKGNGTFTRAYRLNVDLIKKYSKPGAYFSGMNDWGKDYLQE